MKQAENQAVIRPEPTVFADYKDEEFEHSVQTADESVSLKRMTAQHGVMVYITERVIYPEEGGMLMKYKDVPYFRQGFVFPEAMDAISNLKRVTTLFLAVLKGKKGRGLIKGRIEAGLAHYCWLADWMFQWYDPNSKKLRMIYLGENKYRQSVRELIKLINGFLDNLKIEAVTDGVGKRNVGRVIGTLIEFDNAYHWRMEDIFSETTKEKLLANPRRELLRLIDIYEQRERAGIQFKVAPIKKAIKYLFLIPKIKRAFKEAVRNVDIEKMGITKGAKGEMNDSYFTMNYGDYDFQGKPIEERQKIWLSMTDGKVPERVFIPVQ